MSLKMAHGHVTSGWAQKWAMAEVELWEDSNVRRTYLREWRGEGAYRKACEWATRCMDRYNRTARKVRAEGVR